MIFLKNVSLRRGSRLLFEGVSLRIHPSERVGVVGDNGCGKSSLFAMIGGELGADQGDLRVNSQTVLSQVRQETPAGDQTAIDYVLDGDQGLREIQRELAHIDHDTDGERAALCYAKMEQIDGYSATSRASRLMHGLGFSTESLNAPTRSFSGGWRVRLNLARALMCPSDLLLLDEPTNHLDLDAVVWLEDWLSNYRGTMLLISHDRDFLDGICNRILHIENHRISSYTGNYSAFEQIRAERMASDQAAHLKQQRAIAHMRDYVRRFRAKATKARQAQSRLKALERMQVIAPAHIHSPFRFDFLNPSSASDPLLKLEQVNCGYASEPVLRGISFSIGSSERIALVGHNGAGKSTLIKLLAGELDPSEGEVIGAKGLNIGYFAQHQLEQLDTTATPMQQLQREFPHSKSQDLRNYLGGFGFGGQRVEEKIGPFSGGEKARLALAILIHRQPNLLLMDEPTNHLDLEMRHALTIAFQNYQGAILLVSHDRHLIRTVTDQLWLVHRGSVKPFEDDIDGYMRWTREDKAMLANIAQAAYPDESNPASLTKKARRQQSARLREQVKPLTQAIQEIELEMERIAKSVKELDKVLSEPETYESESTANLAAMMQKKSNLEKDMEAKEVKWFEASEQLEKVNAELT
ncbi:MAG: ATP-binding cassette domain-containing protein [Arenicellales bacterium]